jgi:uncharacterized membrane protein
MIRIFFKKLPLPRLLLMTLSLIYFIYFGSYAIQRYSAFETGAFDLGVYTQPLWNYLQGHDFSVSLLAEDNGPIRWATHVEPVLFLILPLYRLWPDPRLLLGLQVLAMSLTALPLFALARRRLGSEWLALLMVLVYFLLPATESVTLFDFHAVALVPLFLLSALYFLDVALESQGHSFWLWPERKSEPGRSAAAGRVAYALSALFFGLALACKEDISLHIFMVGLYLLGLRRRWGEGVALGLVGLVWFYVAFQVIIPAYRVGGGESVYVAWFETLGRTPLEIALSPITKPDKVLALIFRPGNMPALAMVTVPLALLPLAGLPLFLLAAPSLAFTFLSHNPTLRQLETWHYAAPMLPFVMLGAVDGLARLLALGNYQPAPGKVSGLYFGRSASAWLGLAWPLFLLITAMFYHNLRGYSPLAQLQEWPEVTPHHALGRTLAAAIPAEASLLAQAQLVPQVAHRAELAIWDGPLSTAYDYIWLDLSHPKLPNRFNAHGELLTGLVIETDFGPVAAQDGYLLLGKGAKREPLPESLFSFTAFTGLPAGAQPLRATFAGELALLAVKTEVRRLATSETEPQLVLYFEALKKPGRDYHLFLYLLDGQGRVIGATDYPQPALYWWPTSRWAAGDRRQVRINTIPWWSGDKASFGYAIGWSRSPDPWDVAARLPISLRTGQTNPPGAYPLDNQNLLPVAAFRRLAGLPYPKPLTLLPLAGGQVVER